MEASERKYFFKPRVGASYERQKVRKLVMGVCHICTFACDHHACCGDPEKVGEMDCKCPCYAQREDKEYYRLSNSNEIEVRSFIDGETQYPAYKSFSHFMLGESQDMTRDMKDRLWESLAFTNFLQFFHDNDETLPKDEATFEAAYPAFMAVVEELDPQMVFVWNDSIRALLLKHKEDFVYKGKLNVHYPGMYLFVPIAYKGDKNVSDEIKKFRLTSDAPEEKLNLTFLNKHLSTYWGKDMDGDRKQGFVRKLRSCVRNGYLRIADGQLLFNENDSFKWTTTRIGYFIRCLVDRYDFVPNHNAGFQSLFAIENMRSNHFANSRMKEDDPCRVCLAELNLKSKIEDSNNKDKKADEDSQD